MTVKNPEADIELQDIPIDEESGTSDPVASQNDKGDIENQPRPQKRDDQKARQLCTEFAATFGKILAFVIVLSSFVVACVTAHYLLKKRYKLEVYIPQTINIKKLTPQGQALHETDYEKLFYNNPSMKSYSQISDTQTRNYYKDYSYIQHANNLSLYINVPKYEPDESTISTAALIDRSVTTKSVKEIYRAYKNSGDIEKSYHDLYQQQPVHRMTDLKPLYRYYDGIIRRNLGDYISFLTRFIILFSPVDNESDYSPLKSDIEKLSKLISMAINATGNSNKGSEASDSLEAIVALTIIGDMFAFAVLSFLFFCSLFRSTRPSRSLVDFVFWLAMFLNIICSLAVVLSINSYHIFKVYQDALPFSEFITVGNLEWLRVGQRYYYFEIIRNLVLIFAYALTYFDPKWSQ